MKSFQLVAYRNYRRVVPITECFLTREVFGSNERSNSCSAGRRYAELAFCV
jgi:hypothetical protein